MSTPTGIEQLGASIDRLIDTALRVKADRDMLYAALKELARCVRGGDETAGVSMDDALLDADSAIEKADEAQP